MKAELIDVMGDDLRVVNAARVSFDKESEWERQHFDPATQIEDVELRLLSEKDAKLISYLAKHGHWTPFSHPQITLRETVPIFVARERYRHVIGFTYNEVSRRYVDSEPEFYTPDAWRKRAENKKQGSSDEVLDDLIECGNGYAYSLSERYQDFLDTASDLYQELLSLGTAPEQARMVLPQSTYTSYYCTGSLAAWARAYKQRIDPHAQKEIQDLAKEWDKIIRPLFPVSWEALTA